MTHLAPLLAPLLARLLLLCVSLLPLAAIGAPLRIAVSVQPIATFVEQVGGEHVEVQSMVRPGYSPATYDPTPRQIGDLANAVAYIRTGVPFENAWMERLRSANPRMRILDLRDGMELRKLEAHHHEDEHRHDDAHRQEDMHADTHEQDPHIWTSPVLVMQMVVQIRDLLSELDPAHREQYARNQADFSERLRQLDRELHALLDPLPNRRFLVFHPAWGYFADTYGLEQEAIEMQGKQPGARALAELVDRARRSGTRVVFVQPQFDRRHAQRVADAIGGRVIAVDPLAANYIDNLLGAARQFAGALQQ